MKRRGFFGSLLALSTAPVLPAADTKKLIGHKHNPGIGNHDVRLASTGVYYDLKRDAFYVQGGMMTEREYLG